MKKKRALVRIFDYVILTFLSAIIVVPLFWLLCNSVKSNQDIRVNMAKFLPSPGEWQFSNYISAWERGNIGRAIINSAIITIASVFCIIVVTYLAAYAIARIRYRGSTVVLGFFVALMAVPLSQVVMIPQYRMISGMNLVSTYSGVILLYVAGGIPFSIFLLTSFLRTFPIEMDEAAAIDGCNKIQIILKILLPLSKPGLATVIIFQSMNIWNDYFTPLIYMQSPKMRTITLSLKAFQGMWGLTDYNTMFAAIATVTFPIVILYVIFQRQFISGLISGSVKG